MGIKDLWTILTPYHERKPLHVLEGKKVGIDLAGWVCESQCVVDYFVQPKMYLRNLYFRTAYLILSGIDPVFVVDGVAPELKHKMISRRNEQNQFMGARPRQNTQAPKEARGRTRFNYVLRQCKDLLVSMGVTCIDADGEAEALCAYLNRSGLIDGIISQDSDCFGYGAITVYRNFSISKQGKTAASGGAIDVYDLRRVWETMDLKQNKAVALALLCGCDYSPEGVEGVGKEAVLKLFSVYSDAEILERLREWRSKANKFTDLELKVDDKGFCNSCGHLGTVQKHNKSGCSSCKLTKGCDSSIWKEQRLTIKAELQIRKKALEDPFFPNEEIICEFLKFPKQPETLNVNWRQPKVVKFIKSLSKQLQWPEIYCFQKIFPLLTRWQVVSLSRNPQTKFKHGSVVPKQIIKKRVVKGVESFEILWDDNEKAFECIFPEQELLGYLESQTVESLWSTIEPQNLVQVAYPQIVDEFLERTTKKKSKKRKKAANSSLNDMSGLLDALPKVPKKSTRKKPAEPTPLITKFFNPIPDDIDIPSDFSDCSIEGSFSEIINEIVNRKPDVSRIGEDQELFYDSPVKNQAPAHTSTPSYTKYLEDDSLLRRVKRKSYQKELHIESFDELGIENQNPAEVSFFFEHGVHDAFEESLMEMTGV